jgi:two-component sensor histidine kinase
VNIFWSDEFMPHGHCFLWRPDLMTLHIASDAIIAISYYSIPFALIYFALRRPDVVYRWVAVLFGVFILACGTTHVLGIVVLWDPIYWVDGGVKAVTAVSSIATAFVVWRIMPNVLAMPSTGQLQAAVASLGTEVAHRRAVEEQVRTLNTALENRVRERTVELEAANAQLKAALQAKEVLLQEVHHRVKNNLQVVSALLAMQAKSAPPDVRVHLQDSASRIEAMGRVHNQLHRAPMIALDLGEYLRTLAKDLGRIYGRADIAVRFSLPLAPVWIDFDAVNPLVLMLNEALSNVFKHAFPEGRAGNIDIELLSAGQGTLVTIADNGVGLATAGKRKPGSMGMNLINMLAEQLGTQATFDKGADDSEGTRFSVRLPKTIVKDP